MLNKLVKDSEQSRKSSNNTVTKIKKNSGPNVNSVDIFSMLSKAQEDFNTNRGPKSPGNNTLLDTVGGPLAALSLGPDVTSQSVMDFFAKAKVRRSTNLHRINESLILTNNLGKPWSFQGRRSDSDR